MKKLFELRNAVLMSVLVGSYVLSYGTTAFAEEMKTFNLDEMIVTATATPVDKVMRLLYMLLHLKKLKINSIKICTKPYKAFQA